MRSLVGGAVTAVLEVWGVANHYLTFWPRLRVAVIAPFAIAVVGVGVVHGAAALARRSTWAARAGAGRLVFAGTLLLMLVSGGGHLYTPDEWTIYGAAVGLVEHGIPAAFADEPYPLYLLVGPVRPRGVPEGEEARWAYSKYGVVSTLLAAPLYALARVTGPGTQLPAHAFPYGNRALPLVPLLFGPLVTAVTASVLFDVVRRLGYGRRAAVVAAAGFVFGSLAWPYSKTLMGMPLAAAFLLGSFWIVARSPADGGTGPRALPALWAAAGGLAGAAVATRYETALFCLPIAVLTLARRGRRRALETGAWFGAGLALVSVPLVLGMNLVRTGTLLDAGYGTEGTLASLAEKPWVGLLGILISPGCGLATHTPLMALGLLGLIWLWKDAGPYALAAGAIVALAIAYYGSLNTWCGYTAWGPRYLVTVGPFMALPLAAVWERAARPPGHGGKPSRKRFVRLGAVVAGGALLWSAGTNVLAVLIDFNRGWQDHWARNLSYADVTWLPPHTGVATHLRLLFREWVMDGIGGLDLYLWHVPFGQVVVAALATAGVACWVVAWSAPRVSSVSR